MRSFKTANKARTQKRAKLETNTEISDSELRLMSKAEVLERTGLTFVSIWRQMREGRFPAARCLGGKSVWIESEVAAWMRALPLREYKQEVA